MTSFMAEDQADQTAQALWFLGEVETFATQAQQWNEWYVGGWSQSNAWGTYPTITMDKDFDVVYTFETFSPNSDPYPNWYSGKGFAPPGALYTDPPLLDYGIQDSAFSSGAFMGQLSCPTSNPQPRWGDYVTTVWDPNYSSPNENDSFWTVQEYTTGGSNQSTMWQALADPPPFFADRRSNESECPNGGGNNCSMTISAPANAQYGDMLIVVLGMAQTPVKSGALPTLPAGWSFLSASNLSGSPQQITSQVGCGLATTSWLAGYVYGSLPGDTGQYKFTNYDKGGLNTCLNLLYSSEFWGSMVAYRGASPNLGSYTAWGFTQNFDSNSFSTSSVVPAGETEFLALFYGTFGLDSPEGSEGGGVSFSAPAGNPALTPETPLTPGTAIPFLAADAPVPAGGQSYGPYSLRSSLNGNNSYCHSGTGCAWIGWGVSILE